MLQPVAGAASPCQHCRSMPTISDSHLHKNSVSRCCKSQMHACVHGPLQSWSEQRNLHINICMHSGCTRPSIPCWNPAMLHGTCWVVRGCWVLEGGKLACVWHGLCAKCGPITNVAGAMWDVQTGVRPHAGDSTQAQLPLNLGPVCFWVLLCELPAFLVQCHHARSLHIISPNYHPLMRTRGTAGKTAAQTLWKTPCSADADTRGLDVFVEE